MPEKLFPGIIVTLFMLFIAVMSATVARHNLKSDLRECAKHAPADACLKMVDIIPSK